MGFIETARDMLLSGADGREVIEYLRTAFSSPERANGATRTLSSLHNVMTMVRNAVAESGAAVPDTMSTFKLSRDEVAALKGHQESARLAKSDALLVIPEFPNVLKTVETLLQSASASASFSRLIIPLLIASGRRFTEICSPRSTFAPTDHPYACVFSGQLKRKRAESGSYIIPLLVPYSTFANGLAALRSKQMGARTDGRRHATSWDTMTNNQIKARYQTPVQYALSKNCVVTLPPCHIHDLRGMYAAAVWELYDCQCAFNRVLMRVLGHCDLECSLSYIHVRLLGCEGIRQSFGPLPLNLETADE